MHTLQFRVPAGKLKEKNDEIHDVLCRLLNKEEASDCYIALKEAIGNAYEASRPEDQVDFLISISSRAVRAKIKNKGGKFDPSVYLSRGREFNPDSTSGRGLAIISKIMHSMLFTFHDEVIELTLTYKRS